MQRSPIAVVALTLTAVLAAPLAARADDTEPPKITHTPVTTADKGKPIHISAKFTDQSKFFPQIFFKWDGAAAYEKPVDMKKAKSKKAKDMYEATLTPKGETSLEYYLEAYDEFGNGPARAGSPEQPFKIDIAAPAPPPEAKAEPPPAAAEPPPAEAKAEPPPAEAPPAEAKAEPPPAEAAPAEAPPEKKPSAKKSDNKRPPPAATASSGGQQRLWTWVAGGTGVGLLLGGTLTGIAFKKADDAYNARLADPTNNPATLKQQYDANKTLGTMSTVSLIGGTVLLAGGVALWFFEPKWNGSQRADNADAKEKPTMQFAATPVQGGAAAVVAGRF